MTRRELVKAAIAHKIHPARTVRHRLLRGRLERAQDCRGGKSQVEFIDRRPELHPALVGLYQLGDDWRGEACHLAIRVVGTGSYEKIFDRFKEARDKSDQYFLVRSTAATSRRPISLAVSRTSLADIAGEPAFAKRLMNRIVERNLVMLETSCKSGDRRVLLGSTGAASAGS